MYPNNRYPDNLPSMDSPLYNSQMRNPSLDINANRPTYYDASYYDKTPPMMQPMFDYMSQPPMMPMTQGIDPRYSSWRESSENRGPIMPSYYDRPPINQPFIHSKPPISTMPYPQDSYPSHEHLGSVRPVQMNILQRISYVIKPQLPELKKIMSRVTSNVVSSTKKKQSSRRQRSRERERERDRDRSHDRNRKPSNSTSGEWVCGKCSFLNFDWRDKCKKCSESKPSAQSGRNFVPGPEDWKCVKCGNFNYARRVECNRCKLPKSSNNR